MRNNRLRCKRSVVRGSITLALLLTLFTLTSFTVSAQDQNRPGSPTHTVSSLQHVPSGRVDLRWNPRSKVLTATLYLRGLQPGSNHAAHIHLGTCSAKGGILYPFRNAVADASGNAVTTLTANNVSGGIPVTGWNITVHRGPTAQTGDILCGNIANPNRTTSVSAPLGATYGMHQRVGLHWPMRNNRRSYSPVR